MIIITMELVVAWAASTRPISKVSLPALAWALIRASIHLGWKSTITSRRSNSTE